MKKLITLALSLLFIFAAVACSNDRASTNTNTNNTGADKAGIEQYSTYYSDLYNQNIKPLSGYNMYTDVNTVNEAYKDKDYPGNEKYLADVKAAYKDSKEKIQLFVDGLRKDAKTDDKELNKMNQDMINQGEKLIKEIDNKLAKLDNITAKDLTKSKDDFIKLVDDTVKSEKSDVNSFSDMIKNMNKKLGIDNNTTK